MKRLIILFICTCAVFSCSSDHATSPNRDKMLYEEAIGPGGGRVGGDDILVTIPPGAFSAETTVEIKLSTDFPVSEFSASGVYIVANLPEDFTLPLHATVRVSGSLSDETFAAVGREKPVPDLDTDMPVFSLTACRDSLDYMLFEIPVPEAEPDTTGLNKKCADDVDFFVTLVTGLKSDQISLNSGILLTLIMPRSYFDNFLQKIQIIEDKFQGLGFRRYQRKIEKLNIAAGPFRAPQGSAPVFLKCPYGEEYPVRIDIGNLDANSMSYHLARVLFETYQPNPSGDLRNVWLHKAIACWAEGLVQNDASHVPIFFPGHEGAPFRQYGVYLYEYKQADHVWYGSGMSSLIRYLADNDPDGGNLFVQFYNVNAGEEKLVPYDCHFNMFVTRISDPVRTWWPAYLQHYIEGGIYGVAGSDILGHVAETWQLRPGSDNKIVHEFNPRWVGDVSCHLYRLNHGNPDDIDENASLLLTLDPGSSGLNIYNIGLMAFEIENNQLRFLGKSAEGSPSLLIQNIRPMFEKNADLLAAATNCNYRSPTVGSSGCLILKAEIEGPHWYKEVAMVQAQLKINVHRAYTDGQQSENEEFLASFGGSNELSGTYAVDENRYTASWDYNPGDANTCRQTGSIVVEYDAEQNMVSYFQCNASSFCNDGSTFYTYVEGKDLPATQFNPASPDASIIFSVSGADAHNHITDCNYVFDSTTQHAEMTGNPRADSGSRIAIYFMTPRNEGPAKR
ncbi:hypothetical protein JW948_14955 [bacterium]|nr:hypothetical protein [bacterium]